MTGLGDKIEKVKACGLKFPASVQGTQIKIENLHYGSPHDLSQWVLQPSSQGAESKISQGTSPIPVFLTFKIRSIALSSAASESAADYLWLLHDPDQKE